MGSEAIGSGSTHNCVLASPFGLWRSPNTRDGFNHNLCGDAVRDTHRPRPKSERNSATDEKERALTDSLLLVTAHIAPYPAKLER